MAEFNPVYTDTLIGPVTSTNSTLDNGQPDDRKWTVMVFMGADTVGGDAPLIEAARADINEMMAVGSGGTLNVLVQVHGDGVPRRFHIGPGNAEESKIPEGEQDPGDGKALAAFIRWSLKKVGHRPKDHSMLVLWGHAYDFAIGRAPTRTGTIDALDFSELSTVLLDLQEELRQDFKVPDPPLLDIIGFDACDVATVEMTCQLSKFATYLLGSQIGVPIPGWPYDRVLERLRFPIGRLMGPAELGAYAVRRYCQAYAPLHRQVSLTLLDLCRTPDLFAGADVLAAVLDLAIARSPATRELFAGLFVRAQTAENKPYVDVADLCLNLVRESGDPLVIEAARALGDLLLAPSPEVVGNSVHGEGHPIIVEHGRNAGGTAKLNGISLYAPHVAKVNDFAAAKQLYLNFEFARQTRWSQFVHALAEAP